MNMQKRSKWQFLNQIMNLYSINFWIAGMSLLALIFELLITPSLFAMPFLLRAFFYLAVMTLCGRATAFYRLEQNHSQSLNRDMMAMYEELEASDEEIRAQYQELMENRDHLQLIQNRNMLLFKASNEVIWELDLKTGMRHFADENYVDDVPLDLIQSTQFEDWAFDLHPDDQKPFADNMRLVMDGHVPYLEFEIRVDDLHHGWKWLKSKVVSLKDDQGKVIMMAGSYSDIDDKKQKEQRIHQLAYFDPLTALANRQQLLELIGTYMISDGIERQCQGVFYYVDMDGFGVINNTYGHDFGDQLIKFIGHRMKENYREVFIARMGGADFGLLFTSESICKSPEPVAEHLLTLLKQPFVLDGRKIFLTASIGISVFYSELVRAEHVLRQADIALRQAKNQGKNQYCLYHKSMSNAIAERLIMAQELRNAIDANELTLHFQPQIQLDDYSVYGFEALLRWNSKYYGNVSPSKFIPVAEETGLIIPIGNWVFRKACEFQLKAREIKPDVLVSINVATQQLENSDFLNEINAIFDLTGADPSRICVEITESSVIESVETVLSHLNLLKATHVNIALDDFGTGYSSLNHLNILPIDHLKIDKSFTTKISHSSKELVLIKSMLTLTQDLGLKLVIEGVEKQEQLDQLSAIGSPIIQGYYFGKPVAEQEALDYLSNTFKEDWVSQKIQ